MFDDVPVRAWLLIALAALAFVPARTVYRHIAHSSSRRDVTEAAGDSGEGASGEYVRSLAVLAVALGLAIFIFTPAAEDFARSPRVWPVLIVGVALWALFTVVRGFASGQIEPLARGLNDTYRRDGQPKRFWASLTWNAALGVFLLWVAYQGNSDASAQVARDRCNDRSSAFSPRETLLGCDDLIRLRPEESGSYSARGQVFLDYGAFDAAVTDFTRAHELDPYDPWPLARRGLAYAWMKDRQRAEADFNTVRATDPSNPALLGGEAVLSINAGDMEAAAERLTQLLDRHPDDMWTLAMRADVYRQMGEHEKSRTDLDRLVELRKKSGGAA